MAETCDVAPPRAVYGVLLNFSSELKALGEAVHQRPYDKPPQAPILYVKPANTWITEGELIPLPQGETVIEAGATLGIVFGRTATRINQDDALGYVAGYCVINDVRLPHTSYYRPALKQLCRDGFCAIGSRLADVGRVGTAQALAVRTYINGNLRQQANTRDLVRGVPRLIADVTEFMTLAPGDILMVGVAEGRPSARAGDCVRVEVEGVGQIENPIIAENRITGVTAGPAT